MSAITFSGITAARARLARLVEGLREAAGGAVVERAAAKVGEQVRAIAERVITRHTASGAAASDTVVDVAGGLVTLHGMPPARGRQWSGRSYLSLQSWWPFRRGMPQAVVKRASIVFARELVAALGMGAPEEALGIAETADAADAARDRKLDDKIRRQEAAEELRERREHERAQEHERKELERGRAQFKRDIAKIYRNSTEGRAKRLVAAQAKRATKRASKAAP